MTTATLPARLPLARSVLPPPEPLLCPAHGRPRIVQFTDGTRGCFRCAEERAKQWTWAQRTFGEE